MVLVSLRFFSTFFSIYIKNFLCLVEMYIINKIVKIKGNESQRKFETRSPRIISIILRNCLKFPVKIAIEKK